VLEERVIQHLETGARWVARGEEVQETAGDGRCERSEGD
jgi:hypothetical protein